MNTNSLYIASMEAKSDKLLITIGIIKILKKLSARICPFTLQSISLTLLIYIEAHFNSHQKNHSPEIL